MKNKKVLMAAASTALVAVVGIGATLAYHRPGGYRKCSDYGSCRCSFSRT